MAKILFILSKEYPQQKSIYFNRIIALAYAYFCITLLLISSNKIVSMEQSSNMNINANNYERYIIATNYFEEKRRERVTEEEVEPLRLRLREREIESDNRIVCYACVTIVLCVLISQVKPIIKEIRKAIDSKRYKKLPLKHLLTFIKRYKISLVGGPAFTIFYLGNNGPAFNYLQNNQATEYAPHDSRQIKSIFMNTMGAITLLILIPSLLNHWRLPFNNALAKFKRFLS
jgi:hypothetical protein